MDTQKIKAIKNRITANLPDFSFERLEPRVMLSADLVAGSISYDLTDQTQNSLHLGHLQGLDNLITSLTQLEPTTTDTTFFYQSPEIIDTEVLYQLIQRSEPTEQFSATAQPSTLVNGLSGLRTSMEGEGYNRQEIIFVDSTIPEYEQLISGISQEQDDTYYLIVLLNEHDKGIEQISRHISNHTDIDAIHLVSHGSEGNLILGDRILNLNTLPQYQTEITSWQNSLKNDADILIYGCDLTGNESETPFNRCVGRAYRSRHCCQ